MDETVSRLYSICITANLGGLLVGLHLALFSGILEMPSFSSVFESDDATSKSVITTALIIGAIVGSVPAGPLTDAYGRRPALLITAALFACGTIVTIFATSISIVVLGRFVAGMGYALANVVCPMYTAEIAPTSQRGILVNFYQLSITVGILTAQISNAIYWQTGPWTAPLHIALVPALGMLALVWLVVPESPIWVRSRAQENTDVEGEKPEKIPLSSLLQDRQGRKRLLIGAGISASQQTTGINAVIFFGPALVSDVLGMHGSNGPFQAAAAVGAVNVIATVGSLFILERFGRRRLLLSAAVPMVLSLCILGLMRFSLVAVNNALGVGALLLFIATFATTYGPIPFIVCSELFPIRYKGVGMGFCSSVLMVCSFSVGATFLPLLQQLGGGIYLIYAFCVTMSTIFVWKHLPETLNLSLTEIEVMLGE